MAAQRGSKELVSLLLEYGGDLNADRDVDRGALARVCRPPCNVELARFLLDHNADPNVNRTGYLYPLSEAARAGNPELIELLLEYGADVTCNAGEVFTLAVCGGQRTITRLLEERMTAAQREDYLDRSLQAAAYEANDILCAWLLEQGGNLNYSGGEYGSPIQAAVSNPQLYDEARYEIVLSCGIDGNMTRSSNNRLLILKTFLDKGATMPSPESIEEFGSPLSVAIGNQNFTAAQALLASREFSDVNVSGGKLHAPLQAAARWIPDIVERLLSLGADVRSTGGTYGTALHAAAYAHDYENVALLIARGADAAAVAGKYGGTLQAAAKENSVVSSGMASGLASVRVMELLREHGAQVNAVGGKYHSALQMASKSGNFEGFRWLMEKGADPRAEGGKFGTVVKAATRKDKVRYSIVSYLEQHVFKDTVINLNFD
jgi:ankyrin repeat protein